MAPATGSSWGRHALREEDDVDDTEQAPQKPEVVEPKDGVTPPPPVKGRRGAPLARCNLPGCEEHPETRGLCSAHWQTHRGYAAPKEKP